MTRPPGPACITCGDHAVALRVEEVDGEAGLARCVAGDGGEELVEIGLVAPVERGDELLVHAGAALERLGRAPAPAPGREGPPLGRPGRWPA